MIPFIIILTPLWAVGHLGWAGLGWAWAKPFVHEQGTVKQIRADRYGNDSRKGGLWSVYRWGWRGFSVFQTTRRKRTSLGCRNKGARRSLSSFVFFSPWLIWTLLYPPKYTLPSTFFHPYGPYSHSCLLNSYLFFFQLQHRSILSFLSWVLIILLGQRQEECCKK